MILLAFYVRFLGLALETKSVVPRCVTPEKEEQATSSSPNMHCHWRKEKDQLTASKPLSQLLR
jgi:hypothetical protein